MATVKITALGTELGLTGQQLRAILDRRGAAKGVTHLTDEGAGHIRRAVTALRELAELTLGDDLPGDRWWSALVERSPALAADDRSMLLVLGAEIGLSPEHAQPEPVRAPPPAPEPAPVPPVLFDASEDSFDLEASADPPWERRTATAPVVEPSVAVEPSPDEPSPNEPSPDEPSPDEPSPDEPSPDEPSPDEPTVSGADLTGWGGGVVTMTPFSPSEALEPSPAEASPTEPSPIVEASPDEPSPVEASPGEPSPDEPSPDEPSPEEPSPVEASPGEPSPVEASPDEPSPVEPPPAATDAAPVAPPTQVLSPVDRAAALRRRLQAARQAEASALEPSPPDVAPGAVAESSAEDGPQLVIADPTVDFATAVSPDAPPPPEEQGPEEPAAKAPTTDFAFGRPVGWPTDLLGPGGSMHEPESAQDVESADEPDSPSEWSDDDTASGVLLTTNAGGVDGPDGTSIVVARPDRSNVDVLDFFSPGRHAPTDRSGAGARSAPLTLAGQTQFADFMGALRRNRIWAAAAVATCLVLSVSLSLRTAPTYASKAVVQLSAVPDPSGRSATVKPNMTTEEEVIQSEVMAQRVLEALGQDGPASWMASGLSANPLADTEILELKYEIGDPLVAQERLQAYIDVYLASRASDFSAARASQLAQIQNLINAINVQIADLESQLAQNPADAGSIENQIDVLKTQRSQKALELADVPTDLKVGQVLQQPSYSGSPVGPDHVRDGILGLIAGLVLGVSVALLRDRLDDSVHTTRQLQEQTNAPVLATIPRVTRRQKGVPTVLRFEDSSTGAAEAYRSLAINVQTELRKRGSRTLVVASSERGEGAPDVLLNLAALLGRAGKHVIVLVADLRSQEVIQALDAPIGSGLTDVLDNKARLRDTVHRTPLANVRVMGVGTTLVAELLASDGLEDVIDDLAGLCDIVLIDAGPVLDSSEFLAVSRAAHQVLLVTSQSGLARRVMHASTQRITNVGASLLGTVVNDVAGPRIAREFTV